MEKFFGTDGIRGYANRFPIVPEFIVDIAKSAVFFFMEQKKLEFKKVIIGRDTRISGDMIEAALSAGFTSMGMDVLHAGVIPTPGLSYVTSNEDVDFAVMISASHNPYYDNGIKFFKADGEKFSDVEQDEITSIYHSRSFSSYETSPGRILDFHESAKSIYSTLFSSYSGGEKILQGLKIVLDTANGACCEMAESVFSSLGADYSIIFNSPDGININENCGSEHTEKLSEKVIENGADFGLAFDGDGDRLIAVDDKGERTTGDQILAILSKLFNDNGVKIDKVVSTVMSNLGLRIFFKEKGIEHISTSVGDRYVYEAMMEKDVKMGGEDSGHLIFRDYQNTGDGILSGVILASYIKKSGEKLSALKKMIDIFPQKLVNVEVSKKPPIDDLPLVQEAIKKVEDELGDSGRVLVRYSGTQNYCRVMVEAKTDEITDKAVSFIVDAVEKEIG